MKLSSSYALAATLALAPLAAYACGSQATGGSFGPGNADGGGAGAGEGGGGPGAGDGGGGSLLGDAATSNGGGGGNAFPCPNPTTQNDFANPILDVGVPANAASLFSAADVGTVGPCMYEPEPGALFPNNWMRLRFRYDTSNQENLFEIKLVIPNETSPLVIYTTQSAYTLDAKTWQKITSVGVNAPIQVSVRSAVLSGSALSGGPWSGTSGTIQVAPVPASGSIVYWTTSNGTVLKGFQMGSEAPPQSVLTPAQDGSQCIGCHTSTPDGLYVGLTSSNVANSGDTPAYQDLRTVDGGAAQPSWVSSDALALLARQGQQAASFSAAHWSAGDHILLSMYEGAGPEEIIWTNLEATSQTQGQAWDVVARNGDANEAASAAFSHDGQTIAYTSATSVNSGVNTTDGVIYTVPYNGGKGGAAQALTGASDPNYIQFYPSYSHDDRFIAFNRLPTSLGSASTPASYNNPNSEVFFIPASGGTATRVAANDPPACLGAPSPGITNSWAKWSPQVVQACGNTYYFFIFSSNRDPGASGGPQLYVAPIVIDAGGKVSTYSAIYPWNQPETEHNHTPAWDVFQLPPPPPTQ
jgi:hypothetical protein